MERMEYGRFHAVSFNDNDFEFIVFDDKTMDCPTLGISRFDWMELKPRFVLSGNGINYTHNVNGKDVNTNSQELIGNYIIDDELFSYLKQNGMIRYSTDMAYLYGFSDKNGYDHRKNYGVKSPFKWAKKKGPILVKQKEGKFN